MFRGFLTPRHYFSSSRPPKGTSLAENDAVRRIHKTKGRTKSNDKLGVRPVHPLIPIFLTKFGTLGGLPDVQVWVSERSVIKFRSCGGVEICLFPLTKLIAYTTACCYRTSRDYFSEFWKSYLPWHTVQCWFQELTEMAICVMWRVTCNKRHIDDHTRPGDCRKWKMSSEYIGL